MHLPRAVFAPKCQQMATPSLLVQASSEGDSATGGDRDGQSASGTHMAAINICRRSAVINNNLHSQFVVQRPVRDFVLIKLCAALSGCGWVPLCGRVCPRRGVVLGSLGGVANDANYKINLVGGWYWVPDSQHAACINYWRYLLSFGDGFCSV